MANAEDKIPIIVEENKEIWKTEAKFFQFLKNGIRKIWNTHPVKLKLLKKNRIAIPNTNPKSKNRFPTVSGQVCAICGKKDVEKNFQVDHIIEDTASLTCVADIQSCCEKLWIVCEADLRIICKGCHEVVSYCQRYNVTGEEAVVRKKLAAFKKLSLAEMQRVLYDKDVPPVKTKAGMVKQYEQLLKGE